MTRAKLIAAGAALKVGLMVFFAARSAAFATICDCWSSRIAGSIAAACLGIVLGLALGMRVHERLS